MSTKLRRPEVDEAGWISMCDLLLLLFAVALLIAVGSVAAARVSRVAAASGEQLIGALEEENARLRNEVGDWTITAQTVQSDRDRYRHVLESVGEDADQVAATFELLKQQAASASAIQEHDASQASLVEQLRRTADEARAEATARAAECAVARRDRVNDAERIVALNKVVTELGAELEQERKQSGGHQSALADEKAERLAAESKVSQLTAVVDGAGAVKQELLGIPGDLTNVVFVVDRSQSMERGGRWEDARRTIAGWIKHLPVERCALVLFDSTIAVIPSSLDDGREVEFDARSLPKVDETLRSEMMTQLNAMDPRGATQTLRGLRRAMQFRDLSAIVLFTDGAPDPAGGARSTGDPREQVFALVDAWKAAHPNARIHTVGIGDYFNSSMRDFLLGVASRSGGAFIGR